MKLLAAFLLFASLAFAQDQPIKFRGAYIGQPLTDYGQCNGNKIKLTADGFKSHGRVCDGKGLIYHTKTRGLMNPKTEGEVLYFENQKLAEIKIMIPNEDWDKIKYDMTGKMGQPLSEAPTVYQNGFGARWEYSRGFWEKDGIVAAAGIKVLDIGGQALKDPLTNQPDTEGIEIRIMSANRAKMPETQPSSLD